MIDIEVASAKSSVGPEVIRCMNCSTRLSSSSVSAVNPSAYAVPSAPQASANRANRNRHRLRFRNDIFAGERMRWTRNGK